MLLDTATRLPCFARTRHTLPQHHVTVPRDQGRTVSGMCRAVITIISRDLREAVTLREVARQTVVQVPVDIDPRGWRYASTWWLQPCSEGEAQRVWRAQDGHAGRA